ncbi:MAG: alpha/beta fold hydrolase [Methanomicrobiales archaeon]|nr:alpha/beta fold hydrolase [Methanomicrobiales archaeon]
MDKTYISTLVIAVMICLLVMAGCTTAPSTPGTLVTVTSPPVTQAVRVPQPISFNATPVQFAKVNGVTLGYREFGSGEPLLMAQGFGATIDDWNETFIGILASKYHVYTYDHRGMGYSSDNNATPTIALYADDAAELMPALGYDSMNVYGVSMGSTVSQQLVIDHPERIRKLVLDSVTYSIRIPETKLLYDLIVVSGVNPNQTEGVHKESQANLAWSGSWDRLSGINKTVMLVVGTADVLTPQAVTVQIAGQINGSWLVRFKGLPHFGSKYAPVQYGENALDFLSMDESPLNK